ncbi:unnamed protein product [Effrenium voratum]|uniref:Uncharacterized protein n=1 Tax=Effrenium voratum TaxID=2562239 RepID=A0AA36JMI5_9DINO|nr:unnamed protein product [Effrenium voratum]
MRPPLRDGHPSWRGKRCQIAIEAHFLAERMSLWRRLAAQRRLHPLFPDVPMAAGSGPSFRPFHGCANQRHDERYGVSIGPRSINCAAVELTSRIGGKSSGRIL